MEKNKFIRKVLNNNMRLILSPSHKTQTVVIGFFIRAGTYQENELNNGVAHFLEHIMFQGTKSKTSEQLMGKLDQVGAQYNAGTSYEYTYYYIQGHKDNLKLFIDILFDIYQHPIFDSKKIKSEKKVVIEEIYMHENVPIERIYKLIHKKLFGHSPLHLSIAGTEESVNNLTKNDLIDFRSTYYTPNNTVCVVSGNFKVNEIKKLLEKKISKIPNKDHQIQPIIYRSSFCQMYPYIYIKKNNFTPRVHLAVVFRSFPKYDSRTLAIQLILNIFQNGFSSSLVNYLREKHGLIYNINQITVEYIDEGICGFYLETSSQNLMKVISATLKEIKSLREKRVTDKNLEKAKKKMMVSMMTDKRTPLDDLINYGLAELYYQPKSYGTQKGQIEQLNNVTLEETNEILSETFVFQKLNIFIYGNIMSLNMNELTKNVQNFE